MAVVIDRLFQRRIPIQMLRQSFEDLHFVADGLRIFRPGKKQKRIFCLPGAGIFIRDGIFHQNGAKVCLGHGCRGERCQKQRRE